MRQQANTSQFTLYSSLIRKGRVRYRGMLGVRFEPYQHPPSKLAGINILYSVISVFLYATEHKLAHHSFPLLPRVESPGPIRSPGIDLQPVFVMLIGAEMEGEGGHER